MRQYVPRLLNLKPGEVGLARQLFLVQFLLGVGAAFVFTSSITLFLATYDSYQIPYVYMLAAGLLLVANYGYGLLEHHLPPQRLLRVIILVASLSLIGVWAVGTFLTHPWLVLFLSAWNSVVYMLVGYAFWGMTALIFNVRDSRRLFTLVGAGDIPAKMLGYLSVGLLVPYLGVWNLLWVSVVAFALAYYRVLRFDFTIEGPGHAGHASHDQPAAAPHGPARKPGFVQRVFRNNLIFSITVWSLIGSLLFAVIDFTFLAEIKAKHTGGKALATFIATFFAVGRLLAILVKVFISSRIISRLGLTRSLLLTPLCILPVAAFILLSQNEEGLHFYTFGVMVLLAEVLKSTVQEPAFFVLFQPLRPQDRLTGHLVAKGYALPVALLLAGGGLLLYLETHPRVSIQHIEYAVLVLTLVWMASVSVVHKQYFNTLVSSIQKGYFTGSELFLQDKPVRDLLLSKVHSDRPREVLYALTMLEQSNYLSLTRLFTELLATTPHPAVKRHILARLAEKGSADSLPRLEPLLAGEPDASVQDEWLKLRLRLEANLPAAEVEALSSENPARRKAAILGLLGRRDGSGTELAERLLAELAGSTVTEERLMAVRCVEEAGDERLSPYLKTLLRDAAPPVQRRAMETVGRLQVPELLPDLLAVADAHPRAFQRAILAFGNSVYEQLAEHPPGSEPTRLALIRAAGGLTGEASTHFLQAELSRGGASDAVVEALWTKQPEVSASLRDELSGFVEQRLAEVQRLLADYRALMAYEALADLRKALLRETKSNTLSLLKALALLYPSEPINRVIELLGREESVQTAVAIEMLELVLPKAYFGPLDALLGFIQDPSPLPVPGLKALSPEAALDHLFRTGSPWIRTLACYRVPALVAATGAPARPFIDLVQPVSLPDDALFSETKAFVLSQLTKPSPHAAN